MYLLFCAVFQRLLYEKKKFDGLVRLRRGKHRELQDVETVRQLGIQEDDVINIVVDPATEIEVEIELPYMYRRMTVKNSDTVGDIKHSLTFGLITLREGEFGLVQKDFDDRAVYYSRTAAEDFMPLHRFELMDSEHLILSVHMKFQVKVTDPNGGVQFIKVKPETTNADLEEAMLEPKASVVLFGVDDSIRKVHVFVQLSSESGVFQHFCSAATRHAIRNHVFTEFWDVELEHGNAHCGRFGVRVYGYPGVDTALTVRLRAQHQLGVPAEKVYVRPRTKGSACLEHDEVVGKDCKIVFVWPN